MQTEVDRSGPGAGWSEAGRGWPYITITNRCRASGPCANRQEICAEASGSPSLPPTPPPPTTPYTPTPHPPPRHPLCQTPGDSQRQQTNAKHRNLICHHPTVVQGKINVTPHRPSRKKRKKKKEREKEEEEEEEEKESGGGGGRKRKRRGRRRRRRRRRKRRRRRIIGRRRRKTTTTVITTSNTANNNKHK